MVKHTIVQRKQQKKFHRSFKKVKSLKEGRIIVRNLPFPATEELVTEFFDKCGPIREVNLLRRPDGNPVGCVFIQFNNVHDAKQAIRRCSEKTFLGRSITGDLALEQGRYITSRPDLVQQAVANKNNEYDNNEYLGEEEYDDGTEMTPDVEDDNDVEETKPEVADDEEEETKPEVDKDMLLDSDDVPTTPKVDKKQKRAEWKAKTKKGRVVVRNVSFKATEDDLKKHFGNYGELVEVNLLRRPDGRMVGCAFLQYLYLKQAAFAIKHASGIHFLGRPVILDWAVPKNEYDNKNKPNQDVKIKEEPLDKDEIKIEEDEVESIKSEPDSDAMSEGDSDEKDYGEAEDMDLEEDTKPPVTKPQEKYCSNDVSEGRTVFVKNIPFSVDNKEFKACMEQFGEVEYAVICYDHLTEHSKGTGFAKFKDLASTQKCLEAGTELTLCGQVLDCHKALDRETIKAKGNTSTDKKISKDNRNLYLVKEGVVLAGSKAAENVSVTDMAKRLKMEQVKTQMLRNLNMFVSNNRLIVHNIPPTYDDKRFRELFLSHSGPNAVITEARVMKNMMKVDENGVGQSKEMGFVRFTTQEDAITALRKINNNPNIFTVSKRPIVTFAIENRMIHKIKQQREQKSRDKNPLYNEEVRTRTVLEKKAARRAKRAAKRNSWRLESNGGGVVAQTTVATTTIATKKVKPAKKSSAGSGRQEGKSEGQTHGDSGYAGVAAEPGVTRMRSKYNLKAQATLHTQAVRKVKQKKKSSKKVKQQQKLQSEHSKQAKQKQGSGKNDTSSREEESFNKLVNKYKSKITPAMMKTKWYDSQT